MDSSKKTIAIIAVLMVITVGLVYVDYSSSRSGSSNSFFSSVLKNVFQPTTITPELLSKAAYDPLALVAQPDSSSFFGPYLTLPSGITTSVFTLDSTITILEINNADNAFDIVNILTKQTSPTGAYQFNIINTGTFYLNQTPTSTKTHNYLGIVINNVLYGFQYPAARHQDILRIIDALQNNQ